MASNNKVKGLDELQDKLRKLKGIKDDPDALLAGGYVLERESKINAPVETGFLKSTGQTRKDKKGIVVIFSALYALAQEFGTRFMKGKFFVRRAIEEHGDDIVNATAVQLQKNIEKIAKGG
jgi:HK97 gp10 family phage protein